MGIKSLVMSSVVVLETGLGLETGLETIFCRSWSRLGIEGNLTRSCLGLGLGGLGFFEQDRSRPSLIEFGLVFCVLGGF